MLEEVDIDDMRRNLMLDDRPAMLLEVQRLAERCNSQFVLVREG